MTTVYLTSQPLFGVMRAKAVYRVIGTLIGARPLGDAGSVLDPAVHSEKFREFAPKCINSLAPVSEWSALNASTIAEGTPARPV